ncbi:hypothetical protein ACFYWX_16360 [Streptomyces sp. NPDC002888]|uniref:hypothetical protein n=1 Tax=Streptomyces sp. NPDC002888 TaxID=3364668 RepID=UPI003678BC75
MADVTSDEGKRRTPARGTHGGLGAGAEDVPTAGAPRAGGQGIPEEHGTPIGGKPVSGSRQTGRALDGETTVGRDDAQDVPREGALGATGPSRKAPAGAASVASDEGARLLSHDEADKLALQLHHAVSGFVDEPRSAVEEADHVLEEVASRFTEAVTRRRRTLRGAWQSTEGGEDRPATSTDTEQLRLALRDYRELAERLLRV